MSVLLARVERRIKKTEACWEWTGARATGYGQVWFEGRVQQAHRIVYEALIGPIPEGFELDHLCRNRCCVNPAHLEPVTSRENTMRGVGPTAINAAKTHCKRGHPLSPGNVYTRPGTNGRECLTCKRTVHRGGRSYRPRVIGMDL